MILLIPTFEPLLSLVASAKMLFSNVFKSSLEKLFKCCYGSISAKSIVLDFSVILPLLFFSLDCLVSEDCLFVLDKPILGEDSWKVAP